MFRLTRYIAFAALPAAAVSFCALAQDTSATATRPSPFQHMLKNMDTNGDGRISEAEFLAAASARFKRIDAQNTGRIDAHAVLNSPLATERLQQRAEHLLRRLDRAGNGYITRDEVAAAAQQRFARLDRNGDGKLTPDELTLGRGRHARQDATADDAHAARRAQFAQKVFDKLDQNHDGVVTQDEFVAAAAARFQQLDAQGTGRVTVNEIVAAPRTQARAAKVAAHLIQRMDANGDGAVSQDEFLAAAKKRFSHLDRNGDGFIDADEAQGHGWGHGKRQPAA